MNLTESQEKAYILISIIKEKISLVTSNSTACCYIYDEFFTLYDENHNHVEIINQLLIDIKVDEFNNTLLLGFLSAANIKRDDFTNYYIFLNRIKDKVKMEGKYSESQIEELFYGLE